MNSNNNFYNNNNNYFNNISTLSNENNLINNNNNNNNINDINLENNYMNNNFNNGLNNNNYLLNNYLPFNMFSPFSNFMFQGNENRAFFDKIFFTIERINYQIIHLIETINILKNQQPTIKYFFTFLKYSFKNFIKKYFIFIKKIKEYFFYLKKILNYNNNKNLNKEELENQINKINLLIKITIFSLIFFIILKLF